MDREDSPVTDTVRMVFGAGFAFGVVFTMLILGAVLAATIEQRLFDAIMEPVMLSVAAGVVFAGIVGVALYVLAFPANRLRIPLARDDQPTIEDVE